MQANSPLADRDALQNAGDDTRPSTFLDSRYDSTDDLGDWWNDLGRVDLPA